jgi:hypothetical protein
MKSPDDNRPYEVALGADEPVVTKSGTLFQLINEQSDPCKTLYVVSPTYLFEKVETVVYDDSVVLEGDWDQLESSNWKVSKPYFSLSDRKECERRLARRQVDWTDCPDETSKVDLRFFGTRMANLWVAKARLPAVLRS